MMKIGVIGGSGFIGMPLVRRLLQRSDVEIRIFDILESDYFPQLHTYLNVCDREDVIRKLASFDILINLAAEHRDDVMPRSLYYDVNVQGAKNICAAAQAGKARFQIFTSTVAIYGFVEKETFEDGKKNPFNDYGISKLQAELVYEKWLEDCPGGTLVTVRPTVVFGGGNRGNVYNLLNQVAKKRFIMVGKGQNKKSMAYVENVAAFLEHVIGLAPGHHVFNYVDKPDFTMKTLVAQIEKELGQKRLFHVRLPYAVGFIMGAVVDVIAKLTGMKFPISRIRIKKFAGTTLFGSHTIAKTGFKRPVRLEDGLRKTINFEFGRSNSR